MPFLLAEILNFQGSTYRIGVGSFSEIIINTAFTLGYDIPFIRGMKKTRQSSYLTEIISMAVRVLAVLIISAFILQGVWRQ